MNTLIFDKLAVQSASAPRFVTPAFIVALLTTLLLLATVALRPASLLRASAH